MPKVYRNVIRVSGRADKVAEFQEFVRSGRSLFDFDKAVPEPEFAAGEGERRQWRKEHWGCWQQEKPGESLVQVAVNQAGTEVKYCLSTLGDPPLPVVEQLAKLFPELSVELGFNCQGNHVLIIHRYHFAGGELSVQTKADSLYCLRPEFKEFFSQLDVSWRPLAMTAGGHR